MQALGGAKNHAIILPDADLEFAANHLAAAAFGSAGERCMAISAAVAVGGAGDPLLDLLNRKANEVVVGSGRDPKSEMGPVVTAAAKERIESPDRYRREPGRQGDRRRARAQGARLRGRLLRRARP